ncbi:hypothetical protein [Streptomyces xylophagus]|uniref:hypothetical protein n=1 Tax=Streptomyces xylophagus TaxID=285514 RepID=UPI0005BB3B75|nr:hypothetical protein [Streptomyces xylophagus]
MELGSGTGAFGRTIHERLDGRRRARFEEPDAAELAGRDIGGPPPAGRPSPGPGGPEPARAAGAGRQRRLPSDDQS